MHKEGQNHCFLYTNDLPSISDLSQFHHKPLNRSEQKILLHDQKTELPHKSPRCAGHSLCLRQSCRYQCLYIIWHATQLAPWWATLTHRDFRSSVMLFEPGQSSDVLRRDALCLKYASNLTLPYSWNKKLVVVHIVPLELQHSLRKCWIDTYDCNYVRYGN
jgi:hypothetical protein